MPTVCVREKSYLGNADLFTENKRKTKQQKKQKDEDETTE